MRPYDHLEKYGRPEVDGIDMGEVFVYPKLDGTNARVDVTDNLQVRAGSRKRILAVNDDNAGFAAWCREHTEQLKALLLDIARKRNTEPFNVTLYGEWLVPHTLKTYREDAWNRFWLFDVHIEGVGYLHFDQWHGLALREGMDVVTPLQVITNPSKEQLIYCMNEHNTFLVEDGKGLGEGIVLKNYRWQNQWGRQPWAKLVRNEFKEKHVGFQGPPQLNGTRMVEMEIAAECVTEAVVRKEIAKIENAWVDSYLKEYEKAVIEYRERPIKAPIPRSKLIPQLLGRIYHCVVTEDLWAMVKKHKNPTVDFKKLQQACIMRVKEVVPELF